MTVDAFEGLSVVKANNLLFNETILFGKLECLKESGDEHVHKQMVGRFNWRFR